MGGLGRAASYGRSDDEVGAISRLRNPSLLGTGRHRQVSAQTDLRSSGLERSCGLGKSEQRWHRHRTHHRQTVEVSFPAIAIAHVTYHLYFLASLARFIEQPNLAPRVSGPHRIPGTIEPGCTDEGFGKTKVG